MLGLPTEGYVGDSRRIASVVRPAPHVPIDATIGDVLTLEAGDDDAVAVLACDGVLVGAVHPEARSLPARTPVEDLMIPAPATIRPDMRIDEVVSRLHKDHLDRIFVTAVNGKLIGLIVVDDLHV